MPHDHVDEPGERVAAVEHRSRSANDLDPFDLLRREILVLQCIAAVQPVAVDVERRAHVVGTEPAQVDLPADAARARDRHTGNAGENVERAGRIGQFDLLAVDDGDALRRLMQRLRLRILAAQRTDDLGGAAARRIRRRGGRGLRRGRDTRRATGLAARACDLPGAARTRRLDVHGRKRRVASLLSGSLRGAGGCGAAGARSPDGCGSAGAGWVALGSGAAGVCCARASSALARTKSATPLMRPARRSGRAARPLQGLLAANSMHNLTII